MSNEDIVSTKESSWFRDEYERAKRRNAAVPHWARPVVTLRRVAERTGCRCGHPGSGCTCRPVT